MYKIILNKNLTLFFDLVEDKSIDGCYKGEGGHDNFISPIDIDQKCGHFERMSA